MTDLRTTYLGIPLRSPVGCSASPLCEHLDQVKRMEDHGAGIVVLSSLFEEQIEQDAASAHLWRLGDGDHLFPSPSNPQDPTRLGFGPDEYLEHIRRLRSAVDIPVVGSLNGVTPGGWLFYARRMQDAGAAAIELNLYTLPTNPDETSSSLESRYREIVREVSHEVTIPVAVKLSPFLTTPLSFARQLDYAGAKGLVLFNRFYQPDFDLERMEVVPHLTLSTSAELPLRLHWTAMMHGRVKADLAVTGGVHTAEDVLKCMLAGARAVMLTSALMKRGVEVLSEIHDDLRTWLHRREYSSILQLQGAMNLASASNPEAYERVQYIRMLRMHNLS